MRTTEVSLALVGVVCFGAFAFGYEKNVLMDLCQYIGVRYVRNPDNPECGYIACWDRHPYHMPCAPGLRVHPLFFWGDSYPCTERDGKDQCNYFKNYVHQGQGLGYPVDTDNGRGSTFTGRPQSTYGGSVQQKGTDTVRKERESFSVNVIPQTAPGDVAPEVAADEASQNAAVGATGNDTYVTPNV